MKMPYPIQRTRFYRPSLRPKHALSAVCIIPVIGFIGFVIARLVFSIPS